MASDSLEPSLGLTPDRVHSKYPLLWGGGGGGCEGNAAFTQGQGRMCYMHSPGGVWYSGMKCKPAPPIQISQLVVFKGATLDIWNIGGRGVVVSTSALESEDPGSIPGISNTFSKCPK